MIITARRCHLLKRRYVFLCKFATSLHTFVSVTQHVIFLDESHVLAMSRFGCKMPLKTISWSVLLEVITFA